MSMEDALGGMKLPAYMRLAEELQTCIHLMPKVKGAQKLERSIGKEIRFFHTLSQKVEATQTAQLQSSNLSHFVAVVHAATHLPGVTGVLQLFTSPDHNKSLLIDVVADKGRSWVKVIARKGHALHNVWAGMGPHGDRNVVDQLAEYTECARHHPVSFQSPRIYGAFYNKVTKPMAEALRQKGVIVCGKVVPVDHEAMDSSEENFDSQLKTRDWKDRIKVRANVLASHLQLHTDKRGEASVAVNQPQVLDLQADDLEMDSVPEEDELCKQIHTNQENAQTQWILTDQSRLCMSRIIASFPEFPPFVLESAGIHKTARHDKQKVNLDITALITLVSSVCHGRCNFHFQDKVLNQQALEEREVPTLSALNNFLKDKEWIACRMAWSSFKDIVEKLGGESERKRAQELSKRIILVDDQLSARTSTLKLMGKIKDRSKVVFGTGDQLQAVTVTANSSFIRAAQNQGVTFEVHMVPARALTEQKEAAALPIHVERP